MGNITLSCLLGLMFYIILWIYYLQKREKDKVAAALFQDNSKPKLFTFNFENVIMDKLKVKPEDFRYALYVERFVLLLFIIALFYFVRGLALLICGAFIIMLIAKDSYEKVIYESGITNIPFVNNFINYFVPHIISGNSADQSFLGYIEYSGNQDLAEFYENRNSMTYEAPPHIQQIIDIYDIAKYNEEKGIANYTYILNELSEDISQKQIYYNSFVSKSGEINPIVWAYYVGVPILILLSWQNANDFWTGIGGIIVALILLLFFALFKFLIYKLQRDTVRLIF